MATIIDSLMVAIGLDPKDFNKGAKQVEEGLKKTEKGAEKAQKAIEEQAKKAAEAYGKVREALLDVGVAMLAAFAGKEAISYITRNDAAVGRLAFNIGATAQQVATLQGAFEAMGSTAGEANGALGAMNKIVEELKLNGGSEALYPLARAGVLDIGKFQKATSFLDRMQMLSEAAHKLSPQDAQFLLGQAGFSQDTITILTQNRIALKDLFAEQEKLNKVNQKDIDLAWEREHALHNVGLAFKGLTRTIVNQFGGAISWVGDKLTQFISWLSESAPRAAAFVGLISSAVLLLKGYALTVFAEKLPSAIGVTVRAFGTLLGRLGLVVAALTSAYEIYKLSRGLFDWYEATHREGVTLTPEAAKRVAAGETAGITNGGSGNAGVRNNNPGNLNFAGQSGATRAGRFAHFATMAQGYAAMYRQLQLYVGRGVDTIGKIVPTWAPSSDGNDVAAYIQDVAKKSGLGVGAKINSSNIGALMYAMASHEIGAKNVNMRDLQAGLAMAGSSGGSSITTGDITINTQATDAKGIARDMGRELQSLRLAAASNQGLY